MHPLQKREVERLPEGALVKLRGAPGLGVGRIVQLEIRRGNAVHLLVEWQGLDEGRPYTYQQWERPCELCVVRVKP